jgi:hypothetical protein
MEKNTNEVLSENFAKEKIKVQRIRNYRDFFGSPILLDFSVTSENIKTPAGKMLDELEEKARLKRKAANPYYSFENRKKRASKLIKKIRTHPIMTYFGFSL